VSTPWRELFNRCADGLQSEADERDLAALLRTNAAARREYRAFMEMHAALHWDSSCLAQPISLPPSGSGGRSRRWVAAIMLAVVAAGAAAAVAVLHGRRQPDPPPIAAPLPEAAPLALITQTRFLITGEDMQPLEQGQPFAGGRLALRSGAVALRLRNGVEVVFEGPGEIDLLDHMSAFLYDGNVVVRMPKGTDGFRLKTTTADVLDLGTEFAVKASRDFYTDVQVYEGAVMATGRADGSSPRFPKRLEAGQSARFSPHGPELPEPIPYAESRFVRRLPAEPGIPQPATGATSDAAEELRMYGRPQCDAITVHRAPKMVAIDGRLDDWQHGPGFLSFRDGTPSCPEWADGRMMYDERHLYIAAHVGDPEPMRSVIDPATDPGDGWRGGSVQVRVSTDRAMGWPADGNTENYFQQRRLEPTALQKAAAQNPRLAHLTLWYHAASQTPCLTINSGMSLKSYALNPSGFQGAFSRDTDGKGYVLEYAIPWRLLNCADDPPRAGDNLAVVWQVNWGDEAGRMRRDHMVEIHNPHEPLRINVWERAATWGRAEYR
jgi:hypothetical protein